MATEARGTIQVYPESELAYALAEAGSLARSFERERDPLSGQPRGRRPLGQLRPRTGSRWATALRRYHQSRGCATDEGVVYRGREEGTRPIDCP